MPNEEAEELIRIIRKNRIESLTEAWVVISNRIVVEQKEFFDLNPSISVKVVNHYVEDLEVLKNRYGIIDKAQPPKVAGLMASAILKYRPLVPKNPMLENIEDCVVNEALALYHGICICAGHSGAGIGNKEMAALMAWPGYKEWHKRMLFLFRERNYTSESLIGIFETLCLEAFPRSQFAMSSGG